MRQEERIYGNQGAKLFSLGVTVRQESDLFLVPFYWSLVVESGAHRNEDGVKDHNVSRNS